MKKMLRKLGKNAKGSFYDGWYENSDDRKISATDTYLTIRGSISHRSGKWTAIRILYRFIVEKDSLYCKNSGASCLLTLPESEIQEFVNKQFYFDGV